jgi:hypothetical protein
MGLPLAAGADQVTTMSVAELTVDGALGWLGGLKVCKIVNSAEGSE